jgi:putative DNA primase/helicase
MTGLHGVRMTERAPLPPIQFEALAEALLARAEHIVPNWLPGGVKRGPEWVCGSVRGEPGGSCCVNLTTGRWGDFNDGSQGGDLVSLYAEIHGLTMGKAAVQVARDEGLEDVAGVQASMSHVKPDRPTPPPAAPKAPRIDEGWKTVRPVPAGVPAVNFRHQFREEKDIEHTAEYRHGADLHGYVVRFRTSDGGKDTLPRTWCLSARDGAAKWHWKQFDDPRPLYFPGHALPDGRTVILVEGEKKGDALQALLDAGAPRTYCVASWPGGCKAWEKADWSPLAGCSVILWPDCDSKREPVPRAVQTAVLAQAMEQLNKIGGEITDNDRKRVGDAALELVARQKPFLPADKQPGMKAMLNIGAHLRDAHACNVQMLPLPPVGTAVDGWDCGDAIATDGWDFDAVLSFFAQAHALVAGAEKAPAPSSGAAAGGGDEPPGEKNFDPLADAGQDDDAFQNHLDFLCDQLKCKPYELGVNRKLLIAALRKAPALVDCLGFNELTGAPSTVVPWPWRKVAGPMADSDDLRLGDWLCSEYKLKAASRAALAEAIDTVADGRRFHPIRDMLRTAVWDGKPRLEGWLIHVLGIDPKTLDNPPPGIPKGRRRFLELMGKYLLMGLVARVMDPGVKFDYSPVFEGVPGVGKSTLVKELVGAEFFSDTHFDIGNGKEGMEQLEGLWAYELSEMTAFKRADSEQVKQFFSSTVDRYRGAYGRFVQNHPRQCVIFCTTNKRQYLYDLTGNRRFWPVWIGQQINIEWLRERRRQLFAEAYAAYTAGDRIYPTKDEEVAHFYPEQELRLVETTVQARLYELLTREGSFNSEGRATEVISLLTKFVTLPMLVTALGADAAKSTSLLEQQIRGWLESNGWTLGRESVGQRRRGYFQPEKWPADDDKPNPAPDAAPPHQPPPPAPSPAQAFMAGEGLDDDEPF